MACVGHGAKFEPKGGLAAEEVVPVRPRGLGQAEAAGVLRLSPTVPAWHVLRGSVDWIPRVEQEIQGGRIATRHTPHGRQGQRHDHGPMCSLSSPTAYSV